MANTYTTLSSLFTATANAIREKTGNTDGIVADNFPTEIANIVTLSDGTSDATATASDLMSGKTAYVDGEKITGTLATVTQATPSITVGTDGKITASATQSAGYVASGTKTATKQMTVKGATTYTPSSSAQTIASGTYLTGTQTISAVPTEEKTVTAGTSASTVTPTSGKYLSKVTVDPTPSQTKTATPSTSSQTITPDSGKLLSSVTVNAMSSGALSDITISSAGLITAKVGTSGYLASGTSKTKQMTVKGATTYTPTTSNQTIASGTYLTGTQTIAGDADLVSANIKSGANIFGVAGKASVVDTSDATATASDIADGKTAYVNGVKIVGAHDQTPEQIYLYKAGDKCETSAGGGWDTLYTGTSAQVTWNSDNVVMAKADGNDGSNYKTFLISKNLVDLAPYNKLYIDAGITDGRTSNASDYFYYGVDTTKALNSIYGSGTYPARATSHSTDTKNITTSRTVYQLDISAVTSDYYIVLFAVNYVTVTVYNVWLGM